VEQWMNGFQKKCPNSKYQSPNNDQYLNDRIFKIRPTSVFPSYLVIGNWNLFRAWDLVIGILQVDSNAPIGLKGEI
jgi:hypothetical protein